MFAFKFFDLERRRAERYAIVTQMTLLGRRRLISYLIANRFNLRFHLTNLFFFFCSRSVDEQCQKRSSTTDQHVRVAAGLNARRHRAAQSRQHLLHERRAAVLESHRHSR